MIWIWPLLLSIFIGSLGNILQKSHLTKSDSNGALSGALINIATAIALLLLGLATNTIRLHFEMPIGWLCIGAIIIFTLGGYTYFSALYKLDISTLTIIFTFRAVVTAVLSFIWLQEVSTPLQLSGMILIGIAIFTVQLTQRKKEIHPLTSGFALTVITTILFGVGNVLEREFLKNRSVDQMLYLILVFGISGLGQLGLNYFHRRSMSIRFDKSMINRLVILGLFGGLSAIFSLKSLVLAPSTAVYAFANQAKLIATVILAFFFIGEKSHIRVKIFASIVCIIGLILIR